MCTLGSDPCWQSNHRQVWLTGMVLAIESCKVDAHGLASLVVDVMCMDVLMSMDMLSSKWLANPKYTTPLFRYKKKLQCWRDAEGGEPGSNSLAAGLLLGHSDLACAQGVSLPRYYRQRQR